MSRFSTWLPGLCALPFLGACDPVDGGDPADGSGGCGKVTTTPITDLATRPAGFDQSVGEMVASIEGDYVGTFTWFDNEGPVSVPWPDTSSDWSLRMARAGGEVRLVEVANHGEFPFGNEGGQPCSNYVEMDMQMTIAAGDGTLDEVLDVAVSSLSLNYGVPNVAHELDLEALDGSLGPDDIEMDDGKIDRVSLYANFAAPQVSGSLLVEASSNRFGGTLAGGVAGFLAYKDGANSRCGACGDGEFCHIEYDGSAEIEFESSATCTPLPEACADTPTCDCLTEALCPMQPGSCEAGGEVLTQTCWR